MIKFWESRGSYRFLRLLDFSFLVEGFVFFENLFYFVVGLGLFGFYSYIWLRFVVRSCIYVYVRI